MSGKSARPTALWSSREGRGFGGFLWLGAGVVLVAKHFDDFGDFLMAGFVGGDDQLGVKGADGHTGGGVGGNGVFDEQDKLAHAPAPGLLGHQQKIVELALGLEACVVIGRVL